MRFPFIVSLFVLIAWPVQAAKQVKMSSEQRAAVEHMTAALLYSLACPGFNLNKPLIELVLLRVQVKGADLADGGKFSAESDEITAEQLLALRAKGDLMCQIGEAAYGPNGVVVKGFLKKP